jgi:Lar family restriction alleviation protein
MTNGEKFKTAEKRAHQFKLFCESQKHGCNDCKLKDCAGDGCRYAWLDLEYNKELKTCPFCGSKASLLSGLEAHYILCCNCDCTAAIVARSYPSSDEAIDAWNRRVK